MFLKVCFVSVKNTGLRNIIKIVQGQEVNSYIGIIGIQTINIDLINILSKYPWHTAPYIYNIVIKLKAEILTEKICYMIVITETYYSEWFS